MYIKLAILSSFIAILFDRVMPSLKYWLFEKYPQLDRKPLNCVVCFSWWTGVVSGIALYFMEGDLFNSILVPILALLITITILKLYSYE